MVILLHQIDIEEQRLKEYLRIVCDLGHVPDYELCEAIKAAYRNLGVTEQENGKEEKRVVQPEVDDLSCISSCEKMVEMLPGPGMGLN